MSDSHLLQLAAKYKNNYREKWRPVLTWLDILAENMARYEDLEDFDLLAQEKMMIFFKKEEFGDEKWS